MSEDESHRTCFSACVDACPAAMTDDSPPDLSGVAWWEYDPATDSHRWSAEMWAITGLDARLGPPSLAGWLALIHPDDQDAATLTSVSSLDGSRTDLATFRLVRPDGDVRTLQSWHTSRCAADGTVVSMFGLTLDVTDRHATDRAYEDSQRRMLAARRLTGIASWSLDVESGC